MNTSSRESAPPAGETWTTRQLLRWMTEHFESRGIDSPRIVAEMLLSHVLECGRMRLYMEADRPASTEERERLRALVARAARHEPVQYLLGEAWFFGQPFTVNANVLIPRPSTETIIEHVLQWLRRHDQVAEPWVADIGTGSGCLAISLAMQHPGMRLIATDISEDALDVAKGNATRHGVADRIEFRVGSLYEPLASERGTFDFVCSNPPYIPDHEWPEVAPNVKEYEPHGALRGGEDGLDFVRPLIAGAGAMLNRSGMLLIEIADCQHEAVQTLASAHGEFTGLQILKDHEDFHRVLVASRECE